MTNLHRSLVSLSISNCDYKHELFPPKLQLCIKGKAKRSPSDKLQEGQDLEVGAQARHRHFDLSIPLAEAGESL